MTSPASIINHGPAIGHFDIPATPTEKFKPTSIPGPTVTSCRTARAPTARRSGSKLKPTPEPGMDTGIRPASTPTANIRLAPALILRSAANFRTPAKVIGLLHGVSVPREETGRPTAKLTSRKKKM